MIRTLELFSFPDNLLSGEPEYRQRLDSVGTYDAYDFMMKSFGHGFDSRHLHNFHLIANQPL